MWPYFLRSLLCWSASVPASAFRAKVVDEVPLESYHLVEKRLGEALIGEWDTDYHALWSSWTKVHITRKSTGEIAHGEDRDLFHFLASSHKFGGRQGSAGTRVITVTHPQPFQAMPGDMIAFVEQRMDLMSDVRHRGRLSLDKADGGGFAWTIRWDHGRKWWRSAGHEGEQEAGSMSFDSAGTERLTKQQKAERAHAMGKSLVDDWDKQCRSDTDVIETRPLEFSSQVGMSLGVGLNMAGFGASVDVYLCVDPTFVESRSARLSCIVQQIKGYLQSKEDSADSLHAEMETPHNFTQTESMIDRFSAQVEKMLKPNLPEECYPGICVTMSFYVVPYPPFIWPFPCIGMSLNWPLTIEDIKECGVQANVTTEINEAYTAVMKESDNSVRDDIKSAKNEVQVKMNAPVVGVSADWVQGPSFSFFPVPSVGWWVSSDVSLAISIRQVVKWMRNSMHKARYTKCRADREEYFIQLGKWSHIAHDIESSSLPSCSKLRGRLLEIKLEHRDVDYKNHPDRLVPYVEQLSGEAYARRDVEEVSLGGGYVYIGNDGMSAGITFEILDTNPNTTYHHDCTPFRNFVNHYQKYVVPARDDMIDVDGCDVGVLPAMGYHSCRSVDKGYEPELRAYPSVIVNEQGHVLQSSDSQCTRCLQVTSYGMPCSFCDAENFGFGPSCRQFFDHVWHLGCKSSGVRLPLNHFDHQDRPNMDVRLRCAARGGTIWMKMKDGTLMENINASTFPGAFEATWRASSDQHVDSGHSPGTPVQVEISSKSSDHHIDGAHSPATPLPSEIFDNPWDQMRMPLN